LIVRDFDFSERWLIAGIAVTVGVLVGIGVTVGWRWYRQYRERQRRRRRIEAVSVDHLRNVALPDGSGGLLHVDYLLLTARGLLILDVRDVIGNVFGSDPMVEWTVMQGARRFTFANPQGAMYDRIAALTVLAGDVPIDGRIVFGPGAVFPKGLPRLTLREESLEAEFPLGERAQAERLVALWRGDWDRLRTQLAASEFSARS
jgi:hypothetical protein